MSRVNIGQFLSLSGLNKLHLALETNFIDFLRNKMLFQEKNYIVFVFLLRATNIQKKRKFDFFSPFMFDFYTDSLL